MCYPVNAVNHNDSILALMEGCVYVSHKQEHNTDPYYCHRKVNHCRHETARRIHKPSGSDSSTYGLCPRTSDHRLPLPMLTLLKEILVS